MFFNMADTINRVWVSVERGSYGANKLVKFFAGGDTVQDVTDKLGAAFGELAAANILGHLAELSTEEAFDNLKVGGVVGNDQADNNSSSSNADGPICKHGPKVFKTSKPGAAKSWKAWMCPAPQGAPDQCKPEWL